MRQVYKMGRGCEPCEGTALARVALEALDRLLRGHVEGGRRAQGAIALRDQDPLEGLDVGAGRAPGEEALAQLQRARRHGAVGAGGPGSRVGRATRLAV